jgi:RHS repeat-associated protein
MDEGGGLNYVRARYYVPKLGRFTSKDPLRSSSFDPQTLNRYAYALNNPLRYVDVSGLSAQEGSGAFVNLSSSDVDHVNCYKYRDSTPLRNR